MKKIYIFLLAFISATIVFAKEVEKTKALRVAKNFFVHATHLNVGEQDFKLVYECKSKLSEPVYFVYNIGTDKGFILISADDLVQPVLGYSSSGIFNPDQIPSTVRAWMDGYKEQIEHVKETVSAASLEISMRWQTIYDNNFPQAINGRVSSVPALCQTKWNQAPNENGMCPYDQQHGERCVTGCPATAMAQIMKYWEFPTQGTGFHSYNEQHYGTLSANFGATTYDWNGMPDILNSADNEVALLMFHCGVAVEMNYGVAATGGSGSYVCIDYSPSVEQTCENAYKTYFGYDPSISGKLRANFSDADWTNMVKAELDASRPVQYAGFGNGGGHTWVCDGYDQNNLFHMNWGWGGNSDGYFSLDDLDPASLGAGGGTGGFINNQQMLIGIKPIGGGGGGGGTINQPDISLHSAITVNANPIEVYTPLTVFAEIQNTGTNDFTGDVVAALFNSDGVFISFIEEHSNVTMQANFYYSFQFSTSSLNVIPGQCIIGIFYRNVTDEYSLIAENTFSNPVGINVTGPYSDLQMYSNATVNPTVPHPNQGFSVTADLANVGGSDFFGFLSADLYTLEGEWKGTIEVIANATMQSGFYYTTTFTTSGMNVDPGTYYIAFWASTDQVNWIFFYNEDFPNPIKVTITDPTLSPDSYENDDTEPNAHVFPVVFTGNNADVVTTGSNIHLANDLDYYKIVLPPGNGYTISARADDSYHSLTGLYTDDVLFSFSIDGGEYSTTFDDIMDPPTTVPNGGTVVFAVANYFAGTTGTYQLNLNITRGPIGVEELSKQQLSVYPNPAHDKLTITSEIKGDYTIRVFNQVGEMVKEFSGTALNGKVEVDIQDLTDGLYEVMLIANEGSFTTKLLVQ